MKCPNCGGDSKGPYCDYCGTELIQTAPAAEKMPPVSPHKQRTGHIIAYIVVPLLIFSALWVWIKISSATAPVDKGPTGVPVTVESSATQVVSKKPTARPTAKAAVTTKRTTKTVATTKPTTAPTPGPGSREKPIRKGDTAVFNGMDTLFDQYRLELTVTDVKRGQEAWALAVAGNRFNKKPEAGKEYLLVTYKIKVLDSADGKAVSLNNALFKFVSQKGVKYNDFVSLAGLKPALTDLYKGGEAEGIVYGMVDEGDQPLVVFLERDNGGIWFSVE